VDVPALTLDAGDAHAVVACSEAVRGGDGNPEGNAQEIVEGPAPAHGCLTRRDDVAGAQSIRRLGLTNTRRGKVED